MNHVQDPFPTSTLQAVLNTTPDPLARPRCRGAPCSLTPDLGMKWGQYFMKPETGQGWGMRYEGPDEKHDDEGYLYFGACPAEMKTSRCNCEIVKLCVFVCCCVVLIL